MKYGPNINIVTNGLVLYLDASNPRSLPSSTTWYDLSGHGHDATLHGTTSVSSGYVHIGSTGDITNYITIPSTSLDGLTQWTIELWLYINATNSIDTFLTCGASNDFLWLFSGRSTVNFQNPSSTNISYTTSLQTPFLFTATGVDGNFKVYKDSIFVNSGTATSTINVNSTIGVVLGQEMDDNTVLNDGNQKFLGKYGSIRFYNRPLHQTEITQNYNTQKIRYGL